MFAKICFRWFALLSVRNLVECIKNHAIKTKCFILILFQIDNNIAKASTYHWTHAMAINVYNLIMMNHIKPCVRGTKHLCCYDLQSHINSICTQNAFTLYLEIRVNSIVKPTCLFERELTAQWACPIVSHVIWYYTLGFKI